MPIKITAFRCAYPPCHYHAITKSPVDRHEKICLRNPARKSCLMCGNFEKGSETVYVPHFAEDVGDSDYESKYIYCSVKEEVLEKIKVMCPIFVLKVKP